MDTLKLHHRLWIANSSEVKERSPIIFECTYNGKGESLLLIRYDGQCIGYLNKCVHMPFRLDCEKKTLFDHTRDKIKCSMHGIIYDPLTGESLSPTMCTGEKLNAINVVEDSAGIWIDDECVESVKEYNEMLSQPTRKWILANGFNPDDIDQSGKYNDTPLILACREGEKVIAEELVVSKANVNHRNMDGTTALWACVVSNSFDMADRLLGAGASIDSQNDNGATTLMYAASAGKTEWVKYFLARGSDTSPTSLDGFTALDLASNVECLRLLKAVPVTVE